MDNVLEKLWVSFMDSPQLRRFVKQGSGRHFFHSDFYRSLRLAKNNMSSSIATFTKPSLFKDVKKFCLFVGHNKSGTSMLGSLLDAHPNIILADEFGALDLFSAGFTRDQIFHLLLKGSRRELMKGRVTARRLTPYTYLVPGQWQGRFSRLEVIGDGKASSSTMQLAGNSHLLPQLQAGMKGVDVNLVQVIRNPFDVISVMMVRGHRTFENSINHYFTNCETLIGLRHQVKTRLHAVQYEDFVTHPRERLTQLCNFLEVEPYPDYLHACLSILHCKPDCSRHLVEWTPAWIRVVKDKIVEYEFLQGYSFDS